MLESSRSPIVMCNCITLIHQQGSKICRYERPLNAKTQVMLEGLLTGKTRYQVASYLNTTKARVDDSIYRTNRLLGTHAGLESARLALRRGWIQQ